MSTAVSNPFAASILAKAADTSGEEGMAMLLKTRMLLALPKCGGERFEFKIDARPLHDWAGGMARKICQQRERSIARFLAKHAGLVITPSDRNSAQWALARLRRRGMFLRVIYSPCGNRAMLLRRDTKIGRVIDPADIIAEEDI